MTTEVQATETAAPRPRRYKPGTPACLAIALALLLLGEFMSIGKIVAAPEYLTNAELFRFFGGAAVLLLAVVVFWDRAWGVLRSLRFAVVLIVTLLVASVLGVLIKQRSTTAPERPWDEDLPKVQREIQERFQRERRTLAAVLDESARRAKERALLRRIRTETYAKYGDLRFRDTFVYAETFFLWNLWHKGFNIFGNKVRMNEAMRHEYERRKRIFGPRAASDWWDMARIGINSRRTEEEVRRLARRWRRPMERVFAVAEALDFTRIWKSDWFAMLFLLIFYQVAANVLRRSVWKWSRLGFLLSHLSIAGLLIGCALSRRTEVRGFVELDLRNRRAAADFIRYPKDGRYGPPDGVRVPFDDDLVLRVTNFKADYHKRLLVTAFDGDGPVQKEYKVFTGQEIPLFYQGGRPTYRIVVEDFSPRVAPTWRRVADPQAPLDPLVEIQFALRRAGETVPFRRVEVHAGQAIHPLGGSNNLKLAYVDPATAAERRAWLRFAGGETYGDLIVARTPGERSLRLPVGPGLLDAELDWRGRHYEVRVLEVVPDFAKFRVESLAARFRRLLALEGGGEDALDGRRTSLAAFRRTAPKTVAVLLEIRRLDAAGRVEATENRLVFADKTHNNDGRGFPIDASGHAHGADSGAVGELPLTFVLDPVRHPAGRSLVFVGGRPFGWVEVTGGHPGPFHAYDGRSTIPLHRLGDGGDEVSFEVVSAVPFDHSRLEASYETLPPNDFFHHDPAGARIRIEGPGGTRRANLILSTVYAEIGSSPAIPEEVRGFRYDPRLRVRLQENRRMLPIDWKSALELHRILEPKFRCADGRTVVVPMTTERDWEAFQRGWRRLMAQVGSDRPFPAIGDSYATPDLRRRNRKSLEELFGPLFGILESRAVVAILGGRTAELESFIARTGHEPVAKAVIRVNDPLVYGGFFRHYRFTQMDAKAGDPFYTGIGVQNDAGVYLVLISMYMLGIGTIVMFLVQPYLKRKRQVR